MNLSELLHFPEKHIAKEFFKCLISSAKADGVIDKSEFDLLARIGNVFGFTPPEIKKLMESNDKSDYHPPYELKERFSQLYSIIKVILADQIIHESEMRFARYFAVTSGFHHSDAEKVIEFILQGLKNNEDADELFYNYLKSSKS